MFPSGGTCAGLRGGFPSKTPGGESRGCVLSSFCARIPRSAVKWTVPHRPGPSSLLPTTPAGGHAMSRDPAKGIYKPRSRPMLTRIAPAPQVCSPLCRLGGHVLFGNPANRIHRARFSARPYACLHRIALCGCTPRDGVVPNPAKRIHRAQSGARARDCVYQIGLCGCKS